MGITRFSSIKTFTKGGTLLPKIGKNLQLLFGVVNSPLSGSLDDPGNFVMQFVFQPVSKLNVNDPIRGYVFPGKSIQFQSNCPTLTTFTRACWIQIHAFSPDGSKIIFSPSAQMFVTNNSTVSASIFGTTITDPFGERGFNVWIHTAMTYDGSILKLYVNGSLVISAMPAVQYTGIDTKLFIMSTGNASYLLGLIDNVFCYPTVLSAIEINTLYNAQLANPQI
jgi:Concanavalin A-like lectin/glucanases superfamily